MAVKSNLVFDYLNSINYDKKDLMVDKEAEKQYQPYLINHFLSGNYDTIHLANEMNKYPNTDKRLQYDFLRFAIRRRKRYSKWLKPEVSEKIEAIQAVYGYSYAKARQLEKLVSEKDLELLQKKLYKGGKVG